MKIENIFLSIALFACCLVQTVCSFSQGRWTTNPFDQKVFIENKGQFNEKMADGNTYLPAGMASTVLFGASCKGVDLYFTSGGLTYKHDELVPMTVRQNGRTPSFSGEEEIKKEYEERKWMKSTPRYLSVEWVGANLNAEITAEEPVSFYYTYGGEGKDVNTTINPAGQISNGIKASAYKKIIYKNLYPNIDVEYVFPSDSIGIKYSLILHPGANPSDIKMKYEYAENIFLDSKGNAVIKSSFGEFVDHAPKTFYSPPPQRGDQGPAQVDYDKGQSIESSFELSGNTVSFKIPPLGGGGAVIDPWITNPAFSGFNSAYDVNYDLNGNVYIYGSYDPFQLVKLNSTGVIQWVFNATGLSGFFYGDFAVDEVSGTSYLAGGTGATVFKVNTLGVRTGMLPGNPNMIEIWRAEYNRCINKIVMAGGGVSPSTCQSAMLDTNMVNIIPVDVFSANEATHDMALLAIDNNSNFCYMATAREDNLFRNNYDNILIKCPIPNMVPLAFSVPDGHKFGEVASATYVINSTYHANGMNGMAVSPAWLYTYDSDSLKRWNKNTGSAVAKIDVSPLPPTYGAGLVINNVIRVPWGGLSADECDNVYVGMRTSIMQYNTSLALINTFPLPDTVCDVKMGPNNKLYACGQGFVTQIDITPPITVTQNPASGCGPCDGTATVSAISCGTLSNFNYTWGPAASGQTTQTATGLCPGNYTVTVSAPITNCSNGFMGTGTVTVTGGSGALSATVTAVSAVCNNNNGSATVNITGGTAPYTYLWSPSGGTNATATGLLSGNYIVAVTDANGCSSTQTVTVASSGGGTNTNQSAGICSGYTYTLPGGTVVSTSGTYNDTLTTVNGCDSIITTNLTVNPNPAAAAFSSVTITQGQSVTLTASGGETYSWNNGANGSSITVTPLVTTVYCVTVTDVNNCTDTACVTVTIEPIDCSNAGELYLPNAFSPNGDGENDKLQLYYGNLKCIKTFKLVIYNRWGEKVFETTNPIAQWNGSYRGKTEDTAVFVYYMEAMLISGEEIIKRGNISLVR